MLVSKFFSKIANGNIQLNFTVSNEGKIEILQISTWRNKDTKAVIAAYMAAPLKERIAEFVFSTQL
jgi:hypothetical protein